MSKRCELQKEYFKDFGNYKGNGKYSDDYVKWLEDKVLNQGQSLPIASVSKQRELLLSEMDEWFMRNTMLNVVDIVEFKEAFKQ